MCISETFDLAIQLEEKMSECYREIGKLCRDEATSMELVRLFYDERAHADLLIMGKNYIKETPDVSGLELKGRREMKTALNGIVRLIESVRQKKATLKQAINNAVELEEFFEKFHQKTIAEINDTSLKKLFKALSSDDKTHRMRLMSIIKNSCRAS